MRVALSNASSVWGGVHRVTSMLAEGLQARGHQVVVLGRPHSRLQQTLEGVAPFEPILKGMDLHPRTLWQARQALRRHGAQVVLTLMKKDVRTTAPAAWTLGIPVVVRHANDRPLRGGVYNRLWFGSLPAAHVANSAATRSTLLRSAPWLRAERVSVIHNGVDPEPYAGARPAALGPPPGALVIGFVGRFDLRKGLLDLARAWPAVAAALPQAHLVLVGKGPAEAAVRALLAQAPRVHWPGFRRAVPAVLAALDLLAAPSHWEGFGLIAAEGLAAGVPVVAADASSIPEIVRDGVEGRLVPPRDPAALAAALIGLAQDPEARRRMSAAGPERVRQAFSPAIMLDRYETLLAGVIERRGR
jgi:glycosyltransferase involved in cell wall biosynthesis